MLTTLVPSKGCVTKTFTRTTSVAGQTFTQLVDSGK